MFRSVNKMSKRDSAWCLFLISACAGLFGGLWSGGHDWGGDFAAYIMQAISIVNGSADEFVVRNAFTMNQSSSPMGPVVYPWGFPLLLAPVYSLFGMNLLAFKVVGLLFYLLFLLTLWFGFKPLLKPAELVVFVALFAFNPMMLSFGDNILSDLPFLFFSTLSILMLGHSLGGGAIGRKVIFNAMLGVVMGAACLVRTNGGLLVLVYACMLGMRIYSEGGISNLRESLLSRKAMVAAVPMLSLALTIELPSLFLPVGQNSHWEHLSQLNWPVIWQNMVYYGVLLEDFFSPAPSLSRLGFALYLLSIPMVVVGVRCAWRTSLHMLLYVALTLGLYILWPYQQGLRFVFPIIPIYVYFLVLGVRWLGLAISAIGRRYLLPLGGLVLAFAVSSACAAYQNQRSGRPVPPGPNTAGAVELFAFIRHGTTEDDVIIFHKPRVIRLFTGRSSIRINRVEELVRGDLLVIDENEKAFQINKREKEALLSGRKLHAVFSNASFEVYRLNKADLR